MLAPHACKPACSILIKSIISRAGNKSQKEQINKKNMAATPTICTVPSGELTIIVHFNGRFIPFDKNEISLASLYGICHRFSVMTGFIALFIIASVAYSIASRSES